MEVYPEPKKKPPDVFHERRNPAQTKNCFHVAHLDTGPIFSQLCLPYQEKKQREREIERERERERE